MAAWLNPGVAGNWKCTILPFRFCLSDEITESINISYFQIHKDLSYSTKKRKFRAFLRNNTTYAYFVQ
jgi:hypothetical protein